MYQTTKQITKFLISGVIAVLTDFSVYYGLSLLPADINGLIGAGILVNDLYKALGFIAGTAVTYNLNKFWTWRQADKNNRRLIRFLMLYGVSFVLNVVVNKYALHLLHDNEIIVHLHRFEGSIKHLMTIKIDKFLAFVLATIASTAVNFVGQKLWVFRPRQDQS